jgi:hypothetical protein
MPYTLRSFPSGGTGHEILNVTATVPYSSGTAGGGPLTITCPPDKYLLDRRPDFGVCNEIIRAFGNLTTATLPNGRVLPTGWAGVVWQDLAPTNPSASTPATARCIYA